VFAHRVFDLVAVIGLILYVVSTAHIPSWASTSLIAVVAAGVTLFTIAVISARDQHVTRLEEGLGAVRKAVRLGRYGLGVMRRPAAAPVAWGVRLAGWTCQLWAGSTQLSAFGFPSLLPGAAIAA